MKYTFLMPAYKATYLREAIQSILSQTYTDFQLIISDDCSPEGLKAIVDEFDDDRIIYRRNEKNIGAERLVDHWNLLLGLAQSEYIILSPDDDMYSTRFLEEINKLTLLHPDVNVLKARSQKITASGEVYAKDMLYDDVISQFDNLYQQALPNHISGIGNYVFKTQALIYIGGFADYPFAWWSDVMTNIILSENGMAVTKDILFNFRQSDQNISTRNCGILEFRSKAEATFQFWQDSKQFLPCQSQIDTYHKTCINSWDIYMRNCRWSDLRLAIKSYRFHELSSIIKLNKDIFNSFYIKCLFIKLWLF